MRNPFRSEAEAFRFVLLLVGYFALIVLAKVLFGNVVALIVFVALTLAGIYFLRSRPEGTGGGRRTCGAGPTTSGASS